MRTAIRVALLGCIGARGLACGASDAPIPSEPTAASAARNAGPARCGPGPRRDLGRDPSRLSGRTLNAGGPTHPLVHDRTTDGFVTAANGWKQAALMHFDPWKPGEFGGAGDVSKDLVDGSFVIDTTGGP